MCDLVPLAEHEYAFDYLTGKSHSAAWMASPKYTNRSGVAELGVPKFIPSEFVTLKECKVSDLRERLAVLRKFSDLVSKSWKMVDIKKSDVSWSRFKYTEW